MNKSNTTKLTPILTQLKKLGFIVDENYKKWALVYENNETIFARIINRTEKQKTLVIGNWEKGLFYRIKEEPYISHLRKKENLEKLLKNLI